MNVLLVGFSVIEQKEGVSQALKKLEGLDSHDIHFDFCGMGGHHIETISYLASDIFSRNSYDIILLDLTSSSIRSAFHNPTVAYNFKKHLSAILKYINLRNIKAGLLHFYRKDIDYDRDSLVEVCSEIARDFNVSSLNLGQLIDRIYSTSQINLLFKDVVHTTPEGSHFYAEKILEFVQGFPRHKAPIENLEANDRHSLEPEFLAVPVSTISVESNLEVLHFKRHGLSFEYICIPEGHSIKVKLGSQYQLDGIIAVIGPRSGSIEIQSESGDKSTVLPYDRYAYYERLGHFACKKMCGFITFKQQSSLPEINLLKGDKNMEERIGKLSYLTLSKVS